MVIIKKSFISLFQNLPKIKITNIINLKNMKNLRISLVIGYRINIIIDYHFVINASKIKWVLIK